MAENDTRTHADERRRLIGQLEKDRAQLLRNIETCRIRDIESPIVGEWSLKDIVGHISYWETTITVNLINLREGRDTSSQIFTISESELQLLNEENVSRRRPDLFWQLLDELNEGRGTLMSEVSLLTDNDLGEDGTKERDLVSAVFMHEREHWRLIAAYLAGLGG